MLLYMSKVAKNSKGGRIWIEGDSLRRAGFKPNSRYRVSYNEVTSKITLNLSNKGERLVSKRTRSSMVFPIIDINNLKVLEIFNEDTPIVCKVDKKKIEISVHNIKRLQKERENRFLTRIESDTPLNESSLFTGGGISTHALHYAFKKNKIKTKIQTIAEYDKSYLQVAERNLSPENSIVGKIEDIPFEEIKTTDILSFSMPCTGHSPLGKTSNKISIAEEHKEASTALFGVINYVVASNPAILISENVIQAKQSASYVLLKAELKRLGYEIKEYILDEKQAGSFEKRKRYWFVAVSSGLNKAFPFNKFEVPNYKKKFKTIKSILKDRDNEKWFSAEYFDKCLEKNVKSGRGFRTSFAEDNSEFVNVIPRNYTKRQISNPHLFDKEKSQIRLFTPSEHAQLKGIPSELIVGVSDTKAHEILGQSVLYKQAFGIGEVLSDFIKKLKRV